MEYKPLGKTDLRVSRIGFGCWAIGGHGYGHVDEAESIRAIQKALDLGVNLFDTADVYGFGHSEEVLSKALGLRIKDVVVATKFGVNWDEKGNTFKDCSPDRTVKALEASLKRLRLERIPLYQIHWYDNKTGLDELMNTLLKLQAAGKIHHIGCSNFSSISMDEALSVGRLESFQCEFNLLQRKNIADMKQASVTSDLTVLAYRVLGRGLFTGKYDHGVQFNENDTRSKDQGFKGDSFEDGLRFVQALKDVGQRLGKTPSQVAIRWVLECPWVGSALVGAKTAAQVAENVESLGWALPQSEINFLEGIGTLPASK